MIEHVILVDENDQPQGIAEKLEAHRLGLRHRAFSIFIIKNPANPLILLQKRAANKYHSPNLWTNTCCSHPRPNETILMAAKRRLKEELSIESHLKVAGKFHYVAHFENNLIENEIDYVLVGNLDEQEIKPNPLEVQDYRWIDFATLENELEQQIQAFTPWLKQALPIAKKFINLTIS